VAALKHAGLVRPSRRRRLLGQAAAAAAIFVVGALGGRWLSEPARRGEPARATSSYLLLLGGDAAPTADGSSRAAEYRAWARRIGARGGAELVDGGRVIPGAAPAWALQALVDAGGYFIIEADTEGEALAVAGTCPHVKHGGSIVVRRLAGT
jgi:hypothetical protein